MIIGIKVVLGSPMLGDILNSSGVYEFRKRDSETLAFSDTFWNKRISRACGVMGIHDFSDLIVFDDGIRSPKLVEFKMYKTSKIHVKYFECIRSNTRITIPAVLDSLNENCPSLRVVESVFNRIGESEGMSPWGSSSGYGRFSVQSIWRETKML